MVRGRLAAGRLLHGVGLLIFSRVVQGIGAGGLTALAQVVMASVIPPRQLGKYAGIFGAVFAVGTVAGPLIGGVLVDTSWLGWRWCFFIGVPFALLAIALLQRTLRLPTVSRKVRIDWLGAFLIVAGVLRAAHLGVAGRQRVRLGVLADRCARRRWRAAAGRRVFVEGRTPSRSSRSTSSATARSR